MSLSRSGKTVCYFSLPVTYVGLATGYCLSSLANATLNGSFVLEFDYANVTDISVANSDTFVCFSVVNNSCPSSLRSQCFKSQVGAPPFSTSPIPPLFTNSPILPLVTAVEERSDRVCRMTAILAGGFQVDCCLVNMVSAVCSRENFTVDMSSVSRVDIVLEIGTIAPYLVFGWALTDPQPAVVSNQRVIALRSGFDFSPLVFGVMYSISSTLSSTFVVHEFNIFVSNTGATCVWLVYLDSSTGLNEFVNCLLFYADDQSPILATSILPARVAASSCRVAFDLSADGQLARALACFPGIIGLEYYQHEIIPQIFNPIDTPALSLVDDPRELFLTIGPAYNVY